MPAPLGLKRRGDLLGRFFFGENNLYRCLDRLLKHGRELFDHLRERWQDVFQRQVRRAALRSDQHLFRERSAVNPRTSGALAIAATSGSDCVQVVIALIVTPEGYPFAYECWPGTLATRPRSKVFAKDRKAYGKAKRIWVMDRGIPTEEILSEMRQSDPPMYYLSARPKGGSPN